MKRMQQNPKIDEKNDARSVYEREFGNRLSFPLKGHF